jgi:hypothetical protein
VDVEVNLKPTAEFNDAPKPFGMGERGIHLPSLLDSESDGYTALSSAPGGSANVERAANVLEMLGQGSTTNWQQFSAIFSPLMDCVRTFLVPGNHDYEVFGYEFMGISEDKFNEFIDAVADDTVESRHKTILDLLAAIIGSRSAAIDFLIALGGGLPDYQDVSQYKTTGLTQAQAKQYDDTKRALKSNFRALLSAFWAEQAVGGIHFGHNGDARADNSCHEIPSTSGIVRLGFLNSGPIYNHLVNTSPWLRGFPNKEKQTHQAIQNLQQWRDNDAFKDDTLIICMHAPPLTRIFPNTGVTYAAACFTMTPWSPDHEPANADDQSVWDDYKGECEFSNIWQARNFQDPDPDPPLDPVKDPVYAAPLHNHRALLMALSPKVYVGCHSHTGDHSWWEEVEEKIRQRPVLTLAGHTHWKHTYSIDRMTKGTPDYQGYRGCIHFHYGNELINELHEYADNNSADTWWKNRSLIVTTGCVGPIPSPDFKDQYTPVEPGDPGYTPPFESQGYYIVTIEDGVVTRINWNNLWYKN